MHRADLPVKDELDAIEAVTRVSLEICCQKVWIAADMSQIWEKKRHLLKNMLSSSVDTT